ncbi:hypothetical protein MG293_019497 [Ovis ammon polii]|uniref:EGF-like calcium-binding domain-containing protein n=1 Tax=Ovis ammon polii TaxID=230172 RepID=A0AAD4Y105_OVIAM|nr:hypothetical protein MG293_019497 [Ovis ammon polii]KAI4550909.1 hypothetical protein MJT46_018416 [Ovis ammon polii x Ovis aries]
MDIVLVSALLTFPLRSLPWLPESGIIRREHGDPLIEELNPGDALEPEGRGTGCGLAQVRSPSPVGLLADGQTEICAVAGGVVTDFDGDGMLDLILSHGESMAQPLSVFRGNQGFSNNWLRVVPRTRFGAFARGAKVVLYTKKSGAHLRIIDGGSGYLCEMEPVAHFGLGKDEASSVEVTWPDGKMASRNVASSEMNSVLEIPYPRDDDRPQDPGSLECGQGFSQQESGHCADTNECIQFPFVCPRDKPVCVNTYGSYRCRTNKRCNRGYEPNEDGTACVGNVNPSFSTCPLKKPLLNSRLVKGWRSRAEPQDHSQGNITESCPVRGMA